MNFSLAPRIGNRPCPKFTSPSRRLIPAASSSGGSNLRPSVNNTPKPKSEKESEKKANGKPEVKSDAAATETKTVETVAVEKPPKPAIAKAKPVSAVKTFKNRNKFVVPIELRSRFDDVWETRKKLMESSPGFKGLEIDDGAFRKDGSREIAIASEWTSIPEWESYSCSDSARRSHLPPGIYQVVPKKGEGFPEDFTPFVDFADAVNAKY